jgi:hypothetical protein
MERKCPVTQPKTFAFASLLGVAALGLTAYSAASPAAHKEGRTQTISFTTHPTNLLFISPSGQTFQFPTGALAPGTQVLASDSLTKDGTAVGNDYEHCTITFSVNALCDDTAVFVGGDQLRVSYTFQWPSNGPLTSLSGEIVGGTGPYDGARGQFHQAANPDGTFQLTGSYTTTS